MHAKIDCIWFNGSDILYIAPNNIPFLTLKQNVKSLSDNDKAEDEEIEPQKYTKNAYEIAANFDDDDDKEDIAGILHGRFSEESENDDDKQSDYIPNTGLMEAVSSFNMFVSFGFCSKLNVNSIKEVRNYYAFIKSKESLEERPHTIRGGAIVLPTKLKVKSHSISKSQSARNVKHT